MDLKALSVSLRDEAFRRELDKSVIVELVAKFNSIDVEDKISASKVLSNYVSDVPENARLVGSRAHEIVFVTLEKEINAIQMILVSNILTTDAGSIEKDHLNVIFKRLVKVVDCDLESAMDLLDDIADVSNGNEPSLEVDLVDFMSIYHACGDGPLVMKLSGLLHDSDAGNDELYAKLLNEVTNEQLLLNLSYCLNQPNMNTIEYVLSKFTSGDAALKPSLMLIMANFITDAERKEVVQSRLPKTFLINYFESYTKLDISKPWNFQSIALLKKVSLTPFSIDDKTVTLFVEKLKTLCIKEVVQIRFEVVSLQFDVLSKLLCEVTRRDKSNGILDFVNELYGIDSQLDRVLVRLKLNFLTTVKIEELEYNPSEQLNDTLQRIQLDEGKIESSDLSLLSKVLGLYVQDFKSQVWFKEIIQKCQDVANSHQDATSDPNFSIFLNNLQFAKMSL